MVTTTKAGPDQPIVAEDQLDPSMDELSVDELNAQSDENNAAVEARNAVSGYTNANGQLPVDEFDTPAPVEEFSDMLPKENVEIPDSIAAEEAFAVAVQDTSGRDPQETYRRVKGEILETGTSAEVREMRQRIAVESEALSQNVLFNIVNSGDLTIEERVAAVNEHNAMKAWEVDVQLATMNALLLNAPHDPNEDVQETQLNMFQELENQLEMNRSIIDDAEQLGATLGEADSAGGIMGTFIDLMISVSPWAETRGINAVIKDVMPKEHEWWMYVTPGEGLSDVKDKLHSLPMDQQKAFGQTITAAIEKNISETNGGDFQKFMLLHQFFRETETPSLREGYDWDRIFANIGPVLDLTVIYGVAKNSFSLIKALKNSSPAATLLASNRPLAAELLAQGLGNEKVAKLFGTTVEELLHTTGLPKPLNAVGDFDTAIKMPVVPTTFPEKVAALNQKLVDVEELGRNSPLINFTEADIEGAISAYKSVVNNYDGAAIHNAAMTVGVEGEELVARGILGLDGTYGFPKGTQAFDKAVELLGENGKFTIMKMHGDRMIKAKNLTADGEFFIQYETRRGFDDMDAVMFGSKTEAGDPTAVIHIGGHSATNLFDVSTIFSPDISSAALSMHDRGTFIKATLHNILRPFFELPAKSQFKVNDLLEKGANAEYRYSFAEMRRLNLTEAEQVAVHSRYVANDALYILNNQREYKRLVKSGQRYITNPKTKTQLMGNPVEKGRRNIEEAFDPETGKLEDLSAAKIDDIYNSGGGLYEMTHPKYLDAAETRGTTFVIVRQNSKTNVDDIPRNPLNYREGYSTRLYKDLWIIDEHRPVVINKMDTVKSRSTHTAGGPKEALSLAKTMTKKATDGVTYTARRAAEFTTSELEAKLFEIEVARGKVFFSKRGEGLKTTGGRAPLVDPTDSLMRAMDKTAAAVAHEPFVATMKQRWVNTFASGKNSLLKDSDGKFPSQFNMKTTDNIAQKERIELAQSSYDYIRILDGSPDAASRHWKEVALNIADGAADSKFVPDLLSKGAIAASRTDPTVFAKGWSFRILIASNPFRQLPLQMQQFVQLSAITPIYAAKKLPRHMLGMQIGMMAEMGGVAGKFTNVYAKELYTFGAMVSGMDIQEYLKMIKWFKQSGLPTAIDSNVFAASAVSQASTELARNSLIRSANFAVKAVKSPYKAAKLLGFDLGEYFNLAGSYLVARHRYMRNTGKTWQKLNKRDLDQIGADARSLSYGMTEPGRFGYQKGYFSQMMQYQSIQHKAVLAVTPGKFGNKVFSGYEKAGMGAAQLALFGTAAWGVSEAVEAVWAKFGYEPDPRVRAAITGGITDFLLYNTFGDLNLKMAEDFAAGGGLYGGSKNMVMAILHGGWDAEETYFGASWQAGSKVINAVQGVIDIYSTPSLNTSELARAAEALDTILKVTGGYNNYAKHQVMLNLGKFVTKQNDPILTASYDAAWFQLLGFGSKAPTEAYEFNDDIPDKRRSGDVLEPITSAYVKETAQTWYNRVKKVVEFEMRHGDKQFTLNDVQQARLKKAIRAESYIVAFQSPTNAALIKNEFRGLLAKGVEDESDVIVDALLTAAIAGQFSPDTEDFMNTMKSQTFWMPEQLEKIRKVYTHLTESGTFEKEED